MTRGRILSRVALGLLCLILAVAALTARAVSEGEAHLRESDRAFDRGDLGKALLEARSAAVMYAPGAPHVKLAYGRLEAIALGAEAAGQKRTAEAAWRAMRGAALETRHVWIPASAELSRADRNLARLQSENPELVDSGDAKTALERAKSELARDDAPNTAWLGLLIAGFLTVAAGLGLVAVRGVTPDGQLRLARAKLGIALALLGAACWTLAVWRA
jgi:hypothetical protein